MFENLDVGHVSKSSTMFKKKKMFFITNFAIIVLMVLNLEYRLK